MLDHYRSRRISIRMAKRTVKTTDNIVKEQENAEELKETKVYNSAVNQAELGDNVIQLDDKQELKVEEVQR